MCDTFVVYGVVICVDVCGVENDVLLFFHSMCMLNAFPGSNRYSMDYYCIHNQIQYKLYSPSLPPAMGSRFSIFGQCTPAGWLGIEADCYCIHNRCSAKCISTRGSADCVYPCGCVARQLDSTHNVSKVYLINNHKCNFANHEYIV